MALKDNELDDGGAFGEDTVTQSGIDDGGAFGPDATYDNNAHPLDPEYENDAHLSQGRDDEAEEAAAEEAERAARKKKVNIIIYSLIGVAVAAAGFLVLSAGGSDNQAAMEQPQVMQAPVREDPNAQAMAPAGPSDAELASMGGQPVGGQNGELPAGQQDLSGMSDPVQSAPQDATQGVVQGVNQADPSAQAAANLAGNPQALAQAQAQARANPVIDGNGDLMARLGAVETRVEDLSNRFESQEARLGQIQDAVSKLGDTGVVHKAPAVKKAKHKKAAKKSTAKTTKTAAAVNQQDITKGDGVEITALEAAEVKANAARDAKAEVVKAKSTAALEVVAIIPGRAFIESSDGSRLDVEVGDAVSGCGKVTEIDAESGRVTADKCVIK